jgi:hypothetical protein
MNSRVSRCALPPDSSIARHATGASFIDCQSTLADDHARSALRHGLRLMARTPIWIDRLMTLRNRLVQVFGLKDLGRLTRIDLERADADYRPGDRVGIFTLVSQTPDEVLLVDQDRHLDVYLAINLMPLDPQGTRLAVLSTVVQPHNWLGRLYMLPVAPFHRFIAPRMLAMLNQR